MTCKKLIIISGPDRVGKSTLTQRLKKEHGFIAAHFCEPDYSRPGDIFSRYEPCFPNEGESVVWDRSYLCGHILEVFRESVDNYLPLVLQMEYQLYKEGVDVFHLGIALPWQNVAHRHLQEIEKEYSDIQDWAVARLLTQRMKEHRYYTEKMIEFYQHTTIFPAQLLTSNEEIQEFNLEFLG